MVTHVVPLPEATMINKIIAEFSHLFALCTHVLACFPPARTIARTKLTTRDKVAIAGARTQDHRGDRYTYGENKAKICPHLHAVDVSVSLALSILCLIRAQSLGQEGAEHPNRDVVQLCRALEGGEENTGQATRFNKAATDPLYTTRSKETTTLRY